MSYVVKEVTGVCDSQASRSCGRLLLIDDNPKLCRMVREYLEPLGYDITLAHTGPDGLKKAMEGDFHAVLLDVLLPGLDGFEVLKRLRATSTVPVLMLTARGEAPDRIAGLELGADDYIPKTFSPRELLARLRSVIRRSWVTAALARREQQAGLAVGDLRIDPHSHAASFRGQALSLTPTEFDLLLALGRSAGKVKSREELLLEIADRDFEAFDRSVDMHVSSLRRKLGDDPKNPGLIVTVRAVGYLLKATATGSNHELPAAPFRQNPVPRFPEPLPARSDAENHPYYHVGFRVVRPAQGIAVVSAASYGTGPVEPNSIAAAFGTGLLGAVAVRDSAGVSRTPQVLAATATQVNFIVPAGTAAGAATITIGTATAPFAVDTVAPGLFFARADGKGSAAGVILQVAADGAQQTRLIAEAAADLSAGAVYLLLFGTGMRGSSQKASATVGGMDAPLAGPVAQPEYAGLDQVNLGPLPKSLVGSGEVAILLTVDGRAANPVTITIR